MNTPAYQPFPDTHWSLVRRAGFAVGTARREALATLLARYQPALMSYLMRVWRLSEDSAQDLLQGFIADQILERELLKHAQVGHGRFRALLVSCLRNFAVNNYRAQSVRRTASLPVGWEDATEETPSRILEALWARELVGNVLHAMKQECTRRRHFGVWAVFEARLLSQGYEHVTAKSYEQLAREYHLSSPHDAANLLVTGKRMFLRLLRTAVAEYEHEPQQVDAEIADLRRVLTESSGDLSL
jgi:DNA-directed RNA polymerase specialized sigma24 family protein